MTIDEGRDVDVQASPVHRAQARSAAIRAREQRRGQRRRGAGRTALVLAAMALVVGTGVVVQSHRAAPDGIDSAPHGTTTGGGISIGSASAPVEVVEYADFQCPACADFEQRAGAVVADLVAAGTIRVVHQPMAFLDHASTDHYSTRALNAAACVVDSTPKALPAFRAALFAQQPDEGGPGLSDDQLITMAGQAGSDEQDVRPCVEQLRFEGWTQRVTEGASQQGVQQTPTVLVNGRPMTDLSVNGFRVAVKDAQDAVMRR
jgi:protein-disulfide isomerase